MSERIQSPAEVSEALGDQPVSVSELRDFILEHYGNQDMNHTDFRLRAYCLALGAVAARDHHYDAMMRALEGMLDRYTALVNCGDCGNWNPEEEDEVIAARAALAGAK